MPEDDPRILVFNTETTGTLPRKNVFPNRTTLDEYPHLLRLSWVIGDGIGNIYKKRDLLVKPEGYSQIPTPAARKHNLSYAELEDHGQPLEGVLKEFLSDLEGKAYIVAHDINYDLAVLMAELMRKGMDRTWYFRMRYADTQAMGQFLEICADYYESKWKKRDKKPALTVLYNQLFGYENENPHYGMADTIACYQCFLKEFELAEKK